jgi:hypothetical protein
MKTTTTAMTVLAGLSVSLASAPATAQSNSSTLSSFFTSVADGVGSEIGSTTVGWALSAIGLAGGASATNDLEMIETELNQINGDLVAIHTELVAILDAIGNQTCVDTETESDLNHAIDNITTLFGNYQTEFIQPAQAGDPIIQAQLDSWKRAVLDESDGHPQCDLQRNCARAAGMYSVR